MFERYTERARRVIFFSRYEASVFGSPTIESEHFLLGLIREDKNLTNRFLRNSSSLEDIRAQVESRATRREKIGTSIDLPLSNECKRILAYANEEAERLNHRHIGTEHLLLGILREEKCLAAEILLSRGLRLVAIREELAMSLASLRQAAPVAASLPTDEFTVNFDGLLKRMERHGFTEPKGHLFAAIDASRKLLWMDAQVELQIFLEDLLDGINARLAGSDVEAPIFEGFDWRLSMRGFASGLSEEDHWKFRCHLTLLLVELLLKRLEQRLNP